MKIAVTYEDGQVFQHFGKSKQFKIYTIADQKVASSEVLAITGEGHGALAGWLKERGVDALICGGIGGGARSALAGVDIRLYPGVTGSADTAVANLLAGTLQFDPDTRCAHHEGGCHH